MYTLITSGDFTTLPMLHINAPYTRISLCLSTWSALFRMQRILSSLPLRLSIVFLNSSEMSSLWASKRRMIRSERVANQEHT